MRKIFEVLDPKTRTIGQEYKKAVVPIFSKHRVRLMGVAYNAQGWDGPSFDVIYDTPREIRHPDEYGGDDYETMSPRMRKMMDTFNALDDDLYKVQSAFQKKYPDYEFAGAGDFSTDTVRI